MFIRAHILLYKTILLIKRKGASQAPGGDFFYFLLGWQPTTSTPLHSSNKILILFPINKTGSYRKKEILCALQASIVWWRQYWRFIFQKGLHGNTISKYITYQCNVLELGKYHHLGVMCHGYCWWFCQFNFGNINKQTGCP